MYKMMAAECHQRSKSINAFVVIVLLLFFSTKQEKGEKGEPGQVTVGPVSGCMYMYDHYFKLISHVHLAWRIRVTR